MMCKITCPFYRQLMKKGEYNYYEYIIFCAIIKNEMNNKVCPLNSKVTLENNIWELLRTELGY